MPETLPISLKSSSIDVSPEANERILEIAERFRHALVRGSMTVGISTDAELITPEHVNAAAVKALEDALDDTQWDDTPHPVDEEE